MVADDLRAAIDQFMQAVPGMQEVVLWGLCDGASAALMYAGRDQRVRGLVLLNPWVRTEGGLARATLKHYYRDRLLDAGFWRQLVRGKLNFGRSLKSLYALLRAAGSSPALDDDRAPDSARAPDSSDLPDRMHAGLRQFSGQVLLILSGADLTAREFSDLAGGTPKWKRLLASPRLSQRRLEKADHTFSRRAWRDQVAHWTGEWMRSW
jgi:exosortase A-associated hydrolase 1